MPLLTILSILIRHRGNTFLKCIAICVHTTTAQVATMSIVIFDFLNYFIHSVLDQDMHPKPLWFDFSLMAAVFPCVLRLPEGPAPRSPYYRIPTFAASRFNMAATQLL